MSKKCVELIKSDYFRYTGRTVSWFSMVLYTFRNHSFCYSFWMRLSSEKEWFNLFSRFMMKILSNKYGLQIPIGTKIGYGLYIGHGVGVIIHPTTIIGNNCNLSQFTTIGSNHGQAAVIGDNVYIGPSVCIVENVRIGNNVTIGAGAVVVKDIPDNATVAGCPAKVVSYKNPGRYIGKKYEMR